MTEALQKFIRDHADDDLPELLLNASRYREVDVKAATLQIKVRRKIKDKLPEWYQDDRLIFPSSLAAEQCSSEITAVYKQRLVHCNDVLCDLTGGLGVDAFYLSQKMRYVTLIEKNKACCEAVRANYKTLGVTNVRIINDDTFDYLKRTEDQTNRVNVYYADPSRRSTANKRWYAIRDCEPDLLEIIALLPTCYKLIAKLSPMLDIEQVLKQIPNVREVHILSVKNECKELLIVSQSDDAAHTRFCDTYDFADATLLEGIAKPFDRKQFPETGPVIYCINYETNEIEQSFCFRLTDERATVAPVAKKTGRFLYEPNASILKAGAYKSIAWRYGVEKLHTNSHLYTSGQPVMSFPGRLFEITDVLPFNNRLCKTIHLTVPQANIAVRNFPITVDELRKRTRIREGGDVYLYATTLPDNQKALVICRKAP